MGEGAVFTGKNWDIAGATLSFPSGAIGMIDQSRHAAFGYDQRLEVLGSNGLASVNNQPLNSFSFLSTRGEISAPPLDYFRARYRDAYQLEMAHFLAAIGSGQEVLVKHHQIKDTLQVALSLEESARTGKVITMQYADID